MPHRVEGEIIDPQVSVPMAKATSPAAVADAEPAEDPLDPCLRFHGFFVTPPYHISPIASAPIVSFATNIAPASSSYCTTVAVSSIIWSLKGMAPQVVLVPFTARRSLTP